MFEFGPLRKRDWLMVAIALGKGSAVVGLRLYWLATTPEATYSSISRSCRSRSAMSSLIRVTVSGSVAT